MQLRFENRGITGLLTILPGNEKLFVEEMAQFDFPQHRSLKLKEVMGYDRHRLVDGPVCASDLVVRGLEHLFTSRYLAPEEMDALVLVTQSPDHLMPPTSSVVQGRLGLKQDMFCMDINQGCAGFLVGLFQGFMLLDQPSIRKVVLANVDVLSRRVSARDRNSYPLIGDAASIAVLERTSNGPIHANLKMDGTRREALMIPAGGFRIPHSPETAALGADAEGNQRALDHLVMDGSAVFNFVQVEVPPMIEALLASAERSLDSVDAFYFHQPNRFMLQKLAEKIGIPRDKMPANIVEHFGNSSGVTIPLVMAYNGSERLRKERISACLAGFGVGLTWASMLIDLGPMAFCEMIEFP